MTNAPRLLPCILALVVAFPVIVPAATLNVSNTGVDEPTCGEVGPCRSITRAVANAAPGDTIVVGPGLYASDLDNDSVGNGNLAFDASGNYWGAATGPGPDPADTFCGDSGAVPLTSPFLTIDPTQPQSALR